MLIIMEILQLQYFTLLDKNELFKYIDLILLKCKIFKIYLLKFRYDKKNKTLIESIKY